jgi:hypothetical protein
VSDFITHPTNELDVIFEPDGFNKPIDVRFRGPEMFIVDFGVFAPFPPPLPPNTGKVWKVVRGLCAAGGNPVIEMDDQGQPVTLMKRCEGEDEDHDR